MKEARTPQEEFSCPPHVIALSAPRPGKKCLLGISCVWWDLGRGRIKLETTILTLYPCSS